MATAPKPAAPGKITKTLTWNLDIPIGITLQAQLTNDDARFKSQYLGMKQGEFLIIQMPGIPGIREKIVGHCNMIVRFLIAGKVYGFESTVLGHVMRPSPLIFLTFPDSIETINLRSTERVDTFIQAEGYIQDQIVRGMILDISLNGCRYSIDRATGTRWPNIEPGASISLKFKLAPDKEELLLRGDIVMSKKELEILQIGIKFLFADEKDAEPKQAIQSYIKTIQRFLKSGN